MKALLDEQLSPQIAALLREDDFDVIAVAERDDLVARGDRIIFEFANAENRAVITNHIKDLRPLAAEWLAQGRVHAGLILLPSSRTRTRAVVPALAAAIEGILRANPDGIAGRELWIGPSSAE